MKRVFILCIAMVCIFATTSCRGSYEATKSAYEKAMEAAVERPTITPDIPTDGAITEIQPMANASTEPRERTESVNVLDGATIESYSVVVGSFKQRTNAYGMRDRLAEDGYQSCVAQNAQGMYRVIACSYASRAEAMKARIEIIKRYPTSYIGNPWLLVQK